MKTWILKKPTSRMPKQIRTIYRNIYAYTPNTKRHCFAIKSIAIADNSRDLHRYMGIVELSSGVELAVYSGSTDEILEDMENGEQVFAEAVALAVRDYASMGTQFLADILHGLRVRTRKILAEWSAMERVVDFVDVRLLPYDESKGERLAAQLLVRGLDERLKSEVAILSLRDPDELERILLAWLPTMAKRSTARDAVARHGANASIDQIALAAIAGERDIAAILRRVGSGSVLLPNNIQFFMTDGNVRSHGHDEKTGLHWNRNSVTVYGQTLPQTTLAAAIGRSVTDVIAHPLLADDMRILSGSSNFESAVEPASTTIRFAQRRQPFCTISGRLLDGDVQPDVDDN